MSKAPAPEAIYHAQLGQKVYGVPACLTLAQYALESGWGTSKLAVTQHNYFGQKYYPGLGYPYRVVDSEEEVKGKIVVHSSKFIVYPSLAEAFKHHCQRLSSTSGPYKSANKYLRGDWKKFLHEIAPVYSTSSKYESRILELIHLNHLEQYNA